jgi:hypothetical protein
MDEVSTELAIEVRRSRERYDWSFIMNVERLSFVGYDFDSLEIEVVVGYLRLLSQHLSRDIVRHQPWTQHLAWHMYRVKELGRSIIQLDGKPAPISFLYPSLRSLTVHACNPPPNATLPTEIVDSLKRFVKHWQEAKMGPLKLLIRPSPGDQELQWFRDRGVTCTLTSGRDTERYVTEGCSASLRC